MKEEINKIYQVLLNLHGPQGWWPVSTTPNGYHPQDFSYPRNINEQFEICLGAILTQNTNWPNVQKAIENLRGEKLLSPIKIKTTSFEKLIECIRPSGYFNQKAKKIKIFTDFFISLKGETPSRENLLSLWGIGPETADSILLYAFRVPTFVIDAYTIRIFGELKILQKKCTYDKAKEIFEKSIRPDIKIYQEYHALIVIHAKQYFPKKKTDLISPLFDLVGG